VLVDGYHVNDNIYETGYINNEFPLYLDLGEHIEVVRRKLTGIRHLRDVRHVT
jgi:hypothetical protein